MASSTAETFASFTASQLMHLPKAQADRLHSLIGQRCESPAEAGNRRESIEAILTMQSDVLNSPLIPQARQ